MMAALYGVGCHKCNREIASAFKEMPRMAGYLDTQEYADRYHRTPKPWPLPYVDGEHKPNTLFLVPGDDGWLVCLHQGGVLCENDPDHAAFELWRGKVEIR